ncbi:chitin binding [Mactra antiquata]
MIDIVSVTTSSLIPERYVTVSCAQIPEVNTDDKLQGYSECKFPNLWSIEENKCEHFSNVSCGNRVEPISPCQYVTSNCSKPKGENKTLCTCQQYEDLNFETCLNLSDGIYVWPARRWSPFYIECSERRTFPRTCPDGEIFNFIKDECNTKAEFVNEAYNLSLSSEIPETYRYLIQSLSSTTSVFYKNTNSLELTSLPAFSETQLNNKLASATSIRFYNSLGVGTHSESTSENGQSGISLRTRLNYLRPSASEPPVVYSTNVASHSLSSVPFSTILTTTLKSNNISEHRRTVSGESTTYTSLQTHFVSTIKTSVSSSTITPQSSIQPSTVISEHLDLELAQIVLKHSTVGLNVTNLENIRPSMTLSQNLSHSSSTPALTSVHNSTSNDFETSSIFVRSSIMMSSPLSSQETSSIQHTPTYFSAPLYLSDSQFFSFPSSSVVSSFAPITSTTVLKQRLFQTSSDQSNGKNSLSYILPTSSTDNKHFDSSPELSSFDANRILSESKHINSNVLPITDSSLSLFTPISSPLLSETVYASDQLFLTQLTLTPSLSSTIRRTFQSSHSLHSVSVLPVPPQPPGPSHTYLTSYSLLPPTTISTQSFLPSSSLFESTVTEPSFSRTQRTVHLVSQNTSPLFVSSDSYSTVFPAIQNTTLSFLEPFLSSRGTSSAYSLSYALSPSISSSVLSTVTNTSLSTAETNAISAISSSSMSESSYWTLSESLTRTKILTPSSQSMLTFTLSTSDIALSNPLTSILSSMIQPFSESIFQSSIDAPLAPSSMITPSLSTTSVISFTTTASNIASSDSSFDVDSSYVITSTLLISSLIASSSSSILLSTTPSLSPSLLPSTIQSSSLSLQSLFPSSLSSSMASPMQSLDSQLSSSSILSSSLPSLSLSRPSSFSTSSLSSSSTLFSPFFSSTLPSMQPSSSLLQSSISSYSFVSASSLSYSSIFSSTLFSSSRTPTSTITTISSHVLTASSGIISNPSTQSSDQSSIKPTKTLSIVQSTSRLVISTNSFSSSVEMLSSSVSLGNSDRVKETQSEANTSLIVGLSVGLTVALMLLIISVYIVRRRRIKMNTKSGVRLPPELYISENL